MEPINTSSLISNTLGSAGSKGSVVQSFDPSQSRLSAANLIKGGESSYLYGGGAAGAAGIGGLSGTNIGTLGSTTPSGSISNVAGSGNLTSPITPGMPPKVEFRSSIDQKTGKTSTANDDWRIKIDCPALSTMAIFPVLPLVAFNYVANYSPQSLTHSNYASHFYESSAVQSIQITGDFPVQCVADGRVLLNTINFLKATTKMYFGTGANAGNPPPIVFLDGYGKPFMSRISCVVLSFQYSMPNDVDYIKCDNVRLPTTSQLSVTLQPVISRSKAGKFNLNKYATGNLPGFI
jgi:hypothetical protein